MSQKRRIVRKPRFSVPIPTISPRSVKRKRDTKALLNYLKSRRKVVIAFLFKRTDIIKTHTLSNHALLEL